MPVQVADPVAFDQRRGAGFVRGFRVGVCAVAIVEQFPAADAAMEVGELQRPRLAQQPLALVDESFAAPAVRPCLGERSHLCNTDLAVAERVDNLRHVAEQPAGAQPMRDIALTPPQLGTQQRPHRLVAISFEVLALCDRRDRHRELGLQLPLCRFELAQARQLIDIRHRRHGVGHRGP